MSGLGDMKVNSSPLYLKQIVGIVFGLLFLITTAQAESYDCSKASTKVEKLICSDYDLSILDDDLSEAYVRALNHPLFKEQTIQGQRQWLEERDACRDAECVEEAYEARLKELGLSSPCATDTECNRKGTILYAKHQFSRAVPYFLRQLDLAQEQDNKEEALVALNNLALAYSKSGQKYFARAWIKIAQSLSHIDEATKTNAKLILPHVNAQKQRRDISGIYQRYIGYGKWMVIEMKQIGNQTYNASFSIARYGVGSSAKVSPIAFHGVKGQVTISGEYLTFVYENREKKLCQINMEMNGIDIVITGHSHADECELGGYSKSLDGDYYLTKILIPAKWK
jgi:uncharacterized protein YecT (DUF1311 family)